MIITRTPYRISFFGGGTDYPAYYREREGAVLSTTIDKYCYVTCRYLPPYFEHRTRIIYSRMEHVKEPAEIVHPTVRESLLFLGITRGVEIHHDGDVPARGGLGTSSSFTVGLLHALYGLKGLSPMRMQLARDAMHIEQDRSHENIGSQDQVAAAFGGLNRVRFRGDHEILVEPIVMPIDRLQLFQDHMMLVFTGLSRTASEIAGELVAAIPDRLSELAALFQMVDVGIEVLTGENGDLTDFGKLLDEAWCIKRSLSGRIATPEIDSMYEEARRAGAVGGKLLGAGGGGFLLLFAPPERHPRIRAALANLLCVPFRFEGQGTQMIFQQGE